MQAGGQRHVAARFRNVRRATAMATTLVLIRWIVVAAIMLVIAAITSSS
jgi:hypothetical protein